MGTCKKRKSLFKRINHIVLQHKSLSSSGLTRGSNATIFIHTRSTGQARGWPCHSRTWCGNLFIFPISCNNQINLLWKRWFLLLFWQLLLQILLFELKLFVVIRRKKLKQQMFLFLWLFWWIHCGQVLPMPFLQELHLFAVRWQLFWLVAVASQILSFRLESGC